MVSWIVQFETRTPKAFKMGTRIQSPYAKENSRASMCDVLWSSPRVLEAAHFIWNCKRTGYSVNVGEATKNHSFGHYAHVLVDMVLSKRIFDKIMVNRDVYSFYMVFNYKWLRDSCIHCVVIGHAKLTCKKLHKKIPDEKEHMARVAPRNHMQYVKNPT